MLKKWISLTAFILVAAAMPARPAAAADAFCDPAFEDCREQLLTLIRNERVAIDVAFWFMEDSRYTTELARAHNRGVAVRVLVDTRANDPNPNNALRLADLANAGIPMRQRTASGILHWKVMLFHGQNTLQFSGANYSAWALAPVEPYKNYTDEVIYFTTMDSLVNSFRTRYDDLWTNTTQFADYANISGPLQRRYDTFPIDPELNFAPRESFRSRSVYHYNREATAIDAIIYRITDRAHTDALISAIRRGVQVRLLTEPQQYRDPTRMWHSWNVDRLYMAGARIRHRAHAGLLHQKSTLLRSQRMTVFGSSNWTSPSTDSQEEHNYFTVRPDFYQWFSDQFDRKWNNTTGNAESQPFVPLPPDVPKYVSPANGASNVAAESVTLTFNGGYWAHNYDVYFGTTPDPPLYRANEPLGPSTSPSHNLTFTITGLQPGTTYYWRIVGKTMAELTAAGPIQSFRTTGTAPPPPPPPAHAEEIVLWAMRAPVVVGAWSVVSDPTAAGGARLHIPDLGVAKLPASASPADYFELTFNAAAGVPYHLWIRGRADANHYVNDSAHVQFSDSVDSLGTPIWRIGSPDSAVYSVQSGNGAPISEWGWEDDGWGTLGHHVYFASSGPHTIRISRREDGLSIDQIVLSPQAYLETPPGANVNDTTILGEASGGSSPPPDPGPGPGPTPGAIDEIVLYASDAAIVGSSWQVVSDLSAAGSKAVENVNLNLAKVTTALADPPDYVELTFQADANKPYRLWMRMRAEADNWANDSVHVQFSDSVDSAGAATWRIGSAQSTEVNLEDCSGCRMSAWGWQDNGWGVGVMGPVIRFATTGTHTIRIQRREDGVRFDQIVLSAVKYINAAPGPLKDDTTILAR